VSANDRADLAAFAPVDALHLGQDDLPPALARRIVGPELLLGLSTHDEAQMAAAVANPDIDYFCVGPVWETPTKAGRPGVGLGLLERAVALSPPFGPGSRPWFVTGGVAPDTLDDVLATGARRVVVVRAITEAADPAEVSGQLAARLREAAGTCAT
jgi:thiamine-phosphate pyrophosphorylase